MTKKRIDISLVVLAVGIVAMLLAEIFRVEIFGEEQMGELLYSITTRFLGAALCGVIIFKYASKKIFTGLFGAKSLLLLLPCMAVAVNNFPWLSYVRGETYINGSAAEIFVFALMCLGVGLFEELAFRGCILMLIMRNRRSTRKDIFMSIIISSLFFGVVHLSNLLIGASLPSVLRQIGYSFLVGGMCSVLLIKTGNIFPCVLVHSVYNFAGTLIPTLGGGKMWNPPTVIFTALLAVCVALFLIISLARTDPKSLDALYE